MESRPVIMMRDSSRPASRSSPEPLLRLVIAPAPHALAADGHIRSPPVRARPLKCRAVPALLPGRGAALQAWGQSGGGEGVCQLGSVGAGPPLASCTAAWSLEGDACRR